MSPARGTRPSSAVRLLVVDDDGDRRRDVRLHELSAHLQTGDLLVVNDAATLPGSLPASYAGELLELRLLAPGDDARSWQAVLFGAGDWRTPTESRPAPPTLALGDTLSVGRTAPLKAQLVARSPLSDRLLTIRFDAAREEVWRAIYDWGRPVQYAHLDDPLELWSVQTSYASRPWAAESPSAGLPLSWKLLGELRARGVHIEPLTHAAGLSATGDGRIDAALPLPERYDIPASTAAAIESARRRGQRTIAVGTSVVRALESNAVEHGGELRAGSGIARLRIDAQHELCVVDALLTGMHDPSESHHALMSAFIDPTAMSQLWHHAVSQSYLGHEFGDACLLFAKARPTRARSRRRPEDSGGSTHRSRLPAPATAAAVDG